jgi:hypothetical protein
LLSSSSDDGPAHIQRHPTVAAAHEQGEGGAVEDTTPVYSHLVYDVVLGECIVVQPPDVLMIEGLTSCSLRPTDGSP